MSLADLETDIATLMLEALVKDNETRNEIVVPREKMLSYIISNVDSLNFESKKSVGNILIMNNLRSKIQECGEGIVINMDSLPLDVVRQIYDFIFYKKSTMN